jgi:hypothetical protein
MMISRHQNFLNVLAVSGHRVTEGEVNRGDEEVDFDTEPDPFGIDDYCLGGA